MQNENDDIERLFRRAADSYPLKTSGSDWEKVATQLDKEEVSDKAFLSGKNTRPLLLLLLLGILAIGVGYFLNKEGQEKIAGKNQIASENRNIKSEVVSNKLIQSDPATNHNVLVALDNKKKGSVFANTVKENRAQAFDHIKTANKIYSNRIRVKSGSSLSSEIISSQVKNDQNTGINKDQLQIQREIIANVDSLPKKETENLANTSNTNTDPSKNVELSANENEVVKQSSKEQQIKKVSKINNKLRQQYFYASVILGPDISNVKQQNYAGTGYSAGFMLGYTKNKFSLETGLLWDKKYYNTDARYFNPKNKESFYWYGSVVALNGVCNMFEVPVNISYKINNGSRNSFLFKTGIASYIMKKENYDYTYTNYGNIYSANKSYKNSATNLFSVLNVGLKYDRNLNRSLSFGIEPYLKIPVGNIGIGRMPISSTGMFIVLTKKLF